MGGWGEVIGGPKVWARDMGLAVAIGVAIAFLGPFGSYASPLEDRLLSSVSFGVAGSAVMWPFMRLVLFLGRRWGLPEWFAMVGGLILVAAPVTATSWAVAALLHPERAQAGIVVRYFAVLAIVLPIGLAILMFDRMTAPKTAPAPETDAPPRLLARLPGRLGRELIALQAEDHYVRVHTALGSDLLLMRLADAIAELDGLDGLRVHRSWWVARSAVRAVRPDGRKLALTLVNGLDVPVTREATPLVRRAGWG